MRPQPRMRALLTVAALLLLSAVLAPLPAAAQTADGFPDGNTVTVATSSLNTQLPAGDATIAASDPTGNFGAEPTLRVAGEPSPPGSAPAITATHAALLYFNLDLLPPGTEIVSATLELYQAGATTANGAQWLYAANSSWSEASVTWNNAPKGFAGPRPLAFETPQKANVALELDVTAFVRAWLASPPLPNKGFAIVPAAPGGLAGATLALDPIDRVYSSREGERPPLLKVEYRLPPVRVCSEVVDPCAGVAGAEVYDLDSGAVYVADDRGQITTANSIALGHRLWARARVSEGSGAGQSTLYHTVGDPVEVQPDAFVGGGNATELPVAVTAAAPLHVRKLNVSAQWYFDENDPALRDYLRGQIVAASNFLYAFTDGQFILGEVAVRQGWEGWEEADLRLYANTTLRPKAIIGGSALSATPDVSPTIPITYFPGPMSLPSYWNRFGTPPGQVNVVGGQVVPPDVTQDDWGYALAHELGHWLLFLFDTYTGVDGSADGTLAALCTGSAMGDTYSPANHGFVFDQNHWDVNCGGTEAHARLNGRTEWDTIAAWHPNVIKPVALVPGPDAPPITQVVFLPPQSAPGPAVGGPIELQYVGGQTASSVARVVLYQGDRAVEQGRPPRDADPPSISPVGAQVGDRLCVYDIHPVADPAQARYQFGCTVLAAGSNTLPMTRDVTWAPQVSIEQTGAQQVRLEVVQAVQPEKVLKARIFPEDGALLAEVTLPPPVGGVTSLSIDLGVPVGPLYVQLYVDEDEAVGPPATRREAVADRGVGGGGAFGPRRLYGGAPVQSSDGNATFELGLAGVPDPGSLDPDASVAWQSMPGAPPLPGAVTLLGQSYRLDAFPPSLAAAGSVALKYNAQGSTAGAPQAAQAAQADASIYFWDGAAWEKLPTVLAAPVAGADGAGLATAASRGPGVYAVFVDSPAANTTFLPFIQAQP